MHQSNICQITKDLFPGFTLSWRRCAIRLLILVMTSLGISVFAAGNQVSLWPTIPFVRGQDICQYQDAYGQKRSVLAREMSDHIKAFLSLGAEAHDAIDILKTIDQLIDKNRSMVSAGHGMDVTLESSLKASIDGLYRQINPRQTNLIFFNPGSLLDVLRALRSSDKVEHIDLRQLSRISGFAWGSYSYGAGCSGDIMATVHIETNNGDSVSFYGQGRPDWVMSSIAEKIFTHYQRTKFPSVVGLGAKSLALLGAPGSPIGIAPTTAIAQSSCEMLKARLPTHEEYEFLSALGDWNGGVSLGHSIWALSGGQLLAPDLRNPSPVRYPDEINTDEVYYYCVR